MMSFDSTVLLLLLSTALLPFSQGANPKDVPPVDQCQALNATEPPQCPNTIGPPCPPCILNTQPDYIEGDPLTFDQDTIQKIQSRMNENLNFMMDNYPPKKYWPLYSGYNVFEGAAG